MDKIQFIIILSILGSIYCIDKFIPSDNKPHLLVPILSRMPTVTEYNLIACPTCKIMLYCVFEAELCEMARIEVDNGEKKVSICRSDLKRNVFANGSFINDMRVRIYNAGPNMLAYCEAEATVPYLFQEEIVINSREHGVERNQGRKPTCRCGWSNKSPQRIVNGQQASLHEYPFMVRLQITRLGISFCGGSIISERIILTAAHCTYAYRHEIISALIGEHDMSSNRETDATRVVDASKVIIHPEYNPLNEKNDISLMVMKQEITFTDKIGRVCMPSTNKNLVNTYVKVMGWGLTQEPSKGGPPQYASILRKVNLKIIDPYVCKVLFSIEPDKRKQICTFNNNKDSCGGDSGGPLVSVNPLTNMFQQVALVSYGRKCGSTDPAVNTNVGYYMDWIRKEVQDVRGGQLCY